MTDVIPGLNGPCKDGVHVTVGDPWLLLSVTVGLSIAMGLDDAMTFSGHVIIGATSSVKNTTVDLEWIPIIKYQKWHSLFRFFNEIYNR